MSGRVDVLCVCVWILCRSEYVSEWKDRCLLCVCVCCVLVYEWRVEYCGVGVCVNGMWVQAEPRLGAGYRIKRVIRKWTDPSPGSGMTGGRGWGDRQVGGTRTRPQVRGFRVACPFCDPLAGGQGGSIWTSRSPSSSKLH